uniref:H15 domain-containing protein n=1 Tax=Monodelphis domestica TaxID=13616 RepID=A0A5F8HA33_MONDO
MSLTPVSATTQEGQVSDGTGASGESKSDCPSNSRRPSLSEVILWAVAGSNIRRGVSLATLKKAVSNTGFNMVRNAQRFKRVLKGLVAKGVLKQVTGTGVSGSFRMGKKKPKSEKARRRPRQKRQRKQAPQVEQQQKAKGRQKKGARKPARRSRK